ncbi:hypothetical protein PR202_ga24965 [Eleusine coracana subsp. coracana]|uniref:RING-type E3 ubiquitin transferase n=1 Tax=Eleusine coracana subsp. coracana TaxID=191504 RepID=A0AAV5D9T9_ELECO|nr:hypothetical protein PR202_ga24965 [Eleusine coracana subsp. coracana]
MVIILAALLCILICALALNSLLRCARHCLAAAPAAATTTITTVVVAAAAPAPAPAVSGLDKTELRKIPVVEYETSKVDGVPDDDTTTTTECAICLGEFVDGEKVRLLPRCRHGFHVGCIDAWLAAHSSCPICRNSLLLEEDDHHHGAAGEATTTVPGEAT